jgi:hypothetical protein
MENLMTDSKNVREQYIGVSRAMPGRTSKNELTEQLLKRKIFSLSQSCYLSTVLNPQPTSWL